jgi:hypothetical protein
MTTATKLTAGDYVGFAEPKANVKVGDDYCNICGRKMGKNGFYINVGISGQILPLDVTDYNISQGCWSVGSECAKKFDSKILGIGA